MTRIWLPLQLVLPITGSKWQKVLGKASVLLCVALSASNALAQTSVCPPPWSNAKFVYGEIMLKGKVSTTANGQTQTINEEGTAQAAIPLNAGCVWSVAAGFGSGSGVTRAVSLNDAVTYPPDPVNDCTSQTVTDTWVGNGSNLTAAIRLEFLTSDTYMFAFGFGEGDTETTYFGGCDASPIQNVAVIGPPFDPSDALIHSPVFPVSSSALLTGTWTFSAVPQVVLEDSFVTALPLQWTVSWAFSPVPDDTIDDVCDSEGSSSIGCQNQSLGEDIPVSGTSFSLHYQSDRQFGRAGADAFAIIDAQGLGGWTLSAHHTLEPQLNRFCIDGSCTPASLQPKALYLGDGRMRSAAKVQAPVRLNGKVYLTSEDGSEVYVFDVTSARHLQTLRPLTGAVLYNFGYDSAGKLISVTDAYNNVTQITRGPNGQPTAIVSPYGQRTTLGVDSHGYLNRVTDPAGKNILLVHSSTGLLTSMTDANGNTSHYQYDNLGRLLKDSDLAGGSTTLSRTDIASGYQVVKATALAVTSTYQTTFSAKPGTSSTQEFTNTEACGVKATLSETQTINQFSESESLPDGTSYNTTFGADPRWGIQVAVPTSASLSFGSLVARTSHKRTASLATAGNPFSLTDQTDTDTVNSRVYTSTFTASNRTFTNTTPVGLQLLETLDAKERITRTQLGALLPTNLAYDSRGRLTSVTRGARSEALTYDTNGYLTSVTDPLGLKTTFTHDAVGNRLTTTLPDGRIIRYAYDGNGNLISVIPPGKLAHDFSFTAVNLLSSYTPPVVPGTGPTRYSYDADRRLSVITRPDGTTVKYNYDHAGRLSLCVTPTAVFNYGYNAATCNLASVVISGGEQLTYGYNGPLLTTTTWTGTIAGKVSRVYDNNFWIASESIDGAGTVAFTYDNDGLLNKAGALTLTRSATNGLITGTTLGLATDARTYDSFGALTGYSASYKGALMYSVDFTRDNLGRITKKTETIGSQATTYGYDYDASGRLISVFQNGHKARSYTYDSNSNRLTATAGTVTTTGNYDAQDRLMRHGSTSYTYTANGELASKSAGGSKTTYQYDVFGNLLDATLASGKKISYVIDPQNHRTGKKVNGMLEAGFLYDDDRLVAKLNGSNVIVSQFIYASSDSVPDYMVAGGVTYRIFSDHLGSPRLVVNTSTGQIVERIDYDEFGNVITDTNPGFQPFGFAGGLYDQDTKLVRFGARDYDPSIGRWTAKDPILFGGGDTNLYGYVLNDPVNFGDPGGLDDVPDVFGESLPSKAQRAQPPLKGIKEYKQLEKEAEKTSWSVFDYFKWLECMFKKAANALCGDDNPPPKPKPKTPCR
jgi:RHS repeat-associated protein